MANASAVSSLIRDIVSTWSRGDFSESLLKATELSEVSDWMQFDAVTLRKYLHDLGIVSEYIAASGINVHTDLIWKQVVDVCDKMLRAASSMDYMVEGEPNRNLIEGETYRNRIDALFSENRRAVIEALGKRLLTPVVSENLILSADGGWVSFVRNVSAQSQAVYHELIPFRDIEVLPSYVREDMIRFFAVTAGLHVDAGHSLWDQLHHRDPRIPDLLRAYYLNYVTLEDLMSQAEGVTPQRVKQLLSIGIEFLWAHLPDHPTAEFPLNRAFVFPKETLRRARWGSRSREAIAARWRNAEQHSRQSEFIRRRNLAERTSGDSTDSTK